MMKEESNSRRLFIFLVLISVILGAYLLWPTKPKTPGEKFRAAIQKIEKACASRQLKPNEQCGEVAKLKPADPLATPEGRFAHSIELPDPLPKDSGYREEMTPREYFDHLCKTEAGEFIYGSIENVQGILQMRPREVATDDELSHLYALEDPYGHVDAEARDTEFKYVTPNRYRFFERSTTLDRQPSWGKEKLDRSYSLLPDSQARFARYSGYNARDIKTMEKSYHGERKSSFGYTWRGIARPNDREMGIAGGELIVLDLETSEVLGVRRGFILATPKRMPLTGIWWNAGAVCPHYGLRDGLDKDFDFSYWFIGKVLRPANYEESFKELAGDN